MALRKREEERKKSWKKFFFIDICTFLVFLARFFSRVKFKRTLRDGEVVKFVALRATGMGLEIRCNGCRRLGRGGKRPSAAIGRIEPRGIEILHLLVARKAINFITSPPRRVRIVLVVADWPH